MSQRAPHRGNGAREQIHLPGNTLLPLYTALGITLALLGLILGWPFVAVGGAITALSVFLWIKAAARDYEQLPRER
ncbi:MAG: hypothetical protein ACRDI2_17190 [Chloroflexota bacterium]